MKFTKFSVAGLSLAMVLTNLVPAAALTSKAPVAAPGAIGIIESNGSVLINGREAKGFVTVWGDELVQASSEARIVFGALGEVKIGAGSSLQLKMENAKLHEAAGTQAFNAALLGGEMNVKLQSESGALVSSSNSEFTASRGADFKVNLQAGHASLQAGRGTVLANAYSSPAKPTDSKALTSTTTKKDVQYLAVRKMERLIGSFQIKAPNIVLAEASRREQAMQDLNTKKASFMRSLSLTTSGAFYGSTRTERSPLISTAKTIGAAESLSGILINGKLSTGRESLWGGEIFEAPKNSGARLTFDSLAQISLNSGAKAKVSIEKTGAAGQSSTRVLAAQLLSGNVNIKFDSEASGYVRAGDSVMAASRGANFRVDMREGNGALDVNSGSVMVIGDWRVVAPAVIKDSKTGKVGFDSKSYSIKPTNLNSMFNVGVKGSRDIAMRVTDENNKPVSEAAVKFTLEGSGMLGSAMFGTNTVEVLTDKQGIAKVVYHAGAVAGTATVNAEVQGTNAKTATRANVTAQDDNFFSWQGGFPAVIVAAAAIGIGAGIWATRQDRLPIKGIGDAVVVP